MDKFYTVEIVWKNNTEFIKFKSEVEALDFIKDKFLVRLDTEREVYNSIFFEFDIFITQYRLRKLKVNNDLFNYDNVTIHDDGRIEYKKGNKDLPKKMKDITPLREKVYEEHYYTLTKHGKYYNGFDYYDTFEELKEEAVWSEF